ncbi:RING-H2 finger protein ATL38-like isoform X1 [Euphorbia lathyris]|uniref:RING-H2 finger protein ATL38-like isoform X1 n=1 Tax=Euphorbia lathyris TaxID=212925 RepID=UPI0033139EB4
MRKRFPFGECLKLLSIGLVLFRKNKDGDLMFFSGNMIGSGMNLVMTVIGFAISTMFIVFVCTRLICARFQLHASRRSFPAASRYDLAILERGLHGIEPVVVANFPTKKYNDDLFLATEDAQCTVCLAEYSDEDTLRILPYCGHSFHVSCIDIWLHQHSTCPVCRISLHELPDKKRKMQPLFSSAIQYPYGRESLDSHSYNCLLSGHGHGLGLSSHMMVSELQDAESVENLSHVSEVNEATKDT